MGSICNMLCRICEYRLHLNNDLETQGLRPLRHGVKRVRDNNQSSFVPIEKDNQHRFPLTTKFFDEEGFMLPTIVKGRPGVLHLQVPLDASTLHGCDNDRTPELAAVHTSCWHLLEATLGPISRSEIQIVIQSLGVPEHAECLNMLRFTNRLDPMECGSARAMIRSCIVENRRNETTTTIRSRFAELPWEIIYVILNYLDDDTMIAFIDCHHWQLHKSFWRGRIPWKYFVEILDYRQEQIDFRNLFLGAKKLLARDRGSLRTRVQIVSRIKSIQEKNRLGVRHGKQSGNHSAYIADWDTCLMWRGAHRLHNIVERISLPETISRISFNFHRQRRLQEGKEAQHLPELYLLKGITLYPGPCVLGYSPADMSTGSVVKDSAQICLTVDVKREISGMQVMIDDDGIRQIRLLHPGKLMSRWICPTAPLFIGPDTYHRSKSHPRADRIGEPAIGMLYYRDSPEQGITLCAMMDEDKITALGSIVSPELPISRQCFSVQACRKPHACLRTTRLWRPHLPPVNLNLNDAQFLHFPGGARLYPELQLPGNYLSYYLFNGEKNYNLSSLTEISCFQGYPFCMVFTYTNGQRRICPSPSLQPKKFISSLRLVDGERFTKLRIIKDVLKLRTRIVLVTDLGHEVYSGSRQVRSCDKVQTLTAPDGEEIVGLFWDVDYEIGIMTTESSTMTTNTRSSRSTILERLEQEMRQKREQRKQRAIQKQNESKGEGSERTISSLNPQRLTSPWQNIRSSNRPLQNQQS